MLLLYSNEVIAMGATVQMNARIDSDIKKSGDAALALIGLGPTQAIRALWEKAARRGRDLEQVAELLCSRDDVPALQDNPLDRGCAFMRSAYETLGIDFSACDGLPSDAEMLEEALSERESERGLS